MSSSTYSAVRFIGYAIPTTPADMVDVGDPNGSGAVAGTYRGLDDVAADISSRLEVLKTAVDTAVAQLPENESGVLSVFVIPEFYWHGVHGPYIHAPGEADPAEVILARLEAEFGGDAYADVLFVFGSVISAQVADIDAVFASSTTKVRNDIVRALGEGWRATDGPLSTLIFDAFVNFVKNCHAYPEVEVRNRSLVVAGPRVRGISADWSATSFTTEKAFDSNEDFLLWDVTGRPVITEQMTAYPVIDTSGGDFKASATDPYSIVRLGDDDSLAVGVEICLDHSDRRLRRSSALSPWPTWGDGIALHLVPSCGMQLHPPSVAAIAGGWAFNCDGQYPLDAATAGSPSYGVVGGVTGVHTDYTDVASAAYGAHTHLARVATAAIGGDPAAVSSHDATFAPLADLDIRVIPIPESSAVAASFAGGAGSVHIYGATTPLPLGS